MSLPDDIEQVVGPKTYTTKQVAIIIGWVIGILLVGFGEYLKYSSYQSKVDELEARHDKERISDKAWITQELTEIKAAMEKEENERKQSISLLWQKYGTLNENN